MEFDEQTNVLEVQDLPTGEKEDKRSACFIVLTGKQAGQMYKIERDELTVGRGSEASICIEDDGVSRVHARFRHLHDGTVEIFDLDSTNGTYCNGIKVMERLLQDGDKIQIGTTTILKFSYQDSVEEEFQRRQYESATRDVLTGCFNKKYFFERLPSEIAFASRHQKPLALAMFDIDHFKKINDTHGHQAGDHVLKLFGEVVADSIRVDDILTRYGGEEFGLIMRETNKEEGLIVAERIRKRVAKTHFNTDGLDICITVSIGLCIYLDKNKISPEALVKLADAELYQAKENGRNCTAVCELG